MFQIVSASVCLILLVASTESCAKEPKLETDNVAVRAREALDTSFYWLLSITDYEPDRFAHDADMFSAWGELALAQKHGNRLTPEQVRERVLRAARGEGWTRAKGLPEVETPNLEYYLITHQQEDLAVSKTSSLRSQNPPTRYSCRIWISEDGRRVVVAYRVDGE
jgi:hypothetical protein